MSTLQGSSDVFGSRPRMSALLDQAEAQTAPKFADDGPRGHWLLGSLPDIQRDRLAFFEHCARYGDFVRFRSVNRHGVVLSHPALVEEILITQHQYLKKTKLLAQNRMVFGDGLLTSEGDFWRRQRRLAQPAFHKMRVAAYAGTMAAYGDRMLDHWTDGELLDIHAELMGVTLEIVAKTLFDADVSGDAPEVGRALHNLLTIFLERANHPLRLSERWPTKRNRRLREIVRPLDEIIYRIINERRADGSDHGDLLSMLMLAQDEDGAHMSEK
ncbi:MAG: cytochrome P450, partial [Chloroflexi bacterium]|nr:cytochrome P450 [Chloroflexota bacterium]